MYMLIPSNFLYFVIICCFTLCRGNQLAENVNVIIIIIILIMLIYITYYKISQALQNLCVPSHDAGNISK
jgi:hypothetical protein